MVNLLITKMKGKFFIRYALLMCVILIAVSTTTAADRSGSKPQWVSKGEEILNSQRSNNTYYFKAIQTVGESLQQAREARITALSEHISQRNKITGKSINDMGLRQNNGVSEEYETFQMVFKNDFESVVFQAQIVDEWWEFVTNKNGRSEYVYYTLFAVSDHGGETIFDRFDITRSYGAAPAFMSIIPGVGQLYKGQKGKGIAMLCGAAAGAGAIIFCENQRASYVAKMQEQPKHAQTYKTRADNYETARNVAIGVTGALVVWSVIDAAVAPGVTRIKVRKGETLRVKPVAFVQPNGLAFGTSLCYTF